jgi:hypothetical protein
MHSEYNVKLLLSHMIKWFVANKLGLNLDKTNIMKFKHIIPHILYYILVIKKIMYSSPSVSAGDTFQDLLRIVANPIYKSFFVYIHTYHKV